jgi:hypothetical protein
MQRVKRMTEDAETQTSELKRPATPKGNLLFFCVAHVLDGRSNIADTLFCLSLLATSRYHTRNNALR